MAKWVAKPEEIQVQSTEKFLQLGKHSKNAKPKRAKRRVKK